MRNSNRLIEITAGFMIFACSMATADLIYIPSTLSAGDTYHLTFVTSGTIDAGAQADTYDTFVQTHANAAGIGVGSLIFNTDVEWRAIVSTLGTVANVRIFDPVSPIFNTGGLLVANDEADLFDGSLSNAISFNESGIFRSAAVWTGSESTGVGAGPSSNRVLGIANSLNRRGSSVSTSSTWIDAGDSTSASQFSVYAISQELTVPIPEPKTAVLAGMTLLACVMTMRRRQQALRKRLGNI